MSFVCVLSSAMVPCYQFVESNLLSWTKLFGDSSSTTLTNGSVGCKPVLIPENLMYTTRKNTFKFNDVQDRIQNERIKWQIRIRKYQSCMDHRGTWHRCWEWKSIRLKMIRTVQKCVWHYLPHISSLIILKHTRMCTRNEQWKDELKLLETIVYLSKKFQRRLMDINMHRYRKIY